MALARVSRNCLSWVYRKTPCNVNKLPRQDARRNFTLGQLRLDKNSKLEQISVDGLSKIALVVDGKYKSLKDVPPFLPYGQVYRARDKFRLKASIATSIFLICVMFYSIRKNQSDKRTQVYELYNPVEKKTDGGAAK